MLNKSVEGRMSGGGDIRDGCECSAGGDGRAALVLHGTADN